MEPQLHLLPQIPIKQRGFLRPGGHPAARAPPWKTGLPAHLAAEKPVSIRAVALRCPRNLVKGAKLLGRPKDVALRLCHVELHHLGSGRRSRVGNSARHPLPAGLAHLAHPLADLNSQRWYRTSQSQKDRPHSPARCRRCDNPRTEPLYRGRASSRQDKKLQ